LVVDIPFASFVGLVFSCPLFFLLNFGRCSLWAIAGYYNPLLSYGDGEEQAVRDAKLAGANGFIVVDLPPEEAIRFRGVCTGEGWVRPSFTLRGRVRRGNDETDPAVSFTYSALIGYRTFRW
jgi:hypothetical protein